MSHNKDGEKKKRAAILELSKYMDKKLRVKFIGGREAVGVLKGHDQLFNLVLDDTIEYFTGDSSAEDTSRELGVCVCRSSAITLIGPEDGVSEIANPFARDE